MSRETVESLESWQRNEPDPHTSRPRSSLERLGTRKQQSRLGSLKRKQFHPTPCGLLYMLKNFFRRLYKTRSIKDRPIRYKHGEIGSHPSTSSVGSAIHTHHTQSLKTLGLPTTKSSHGFEVPDFDPEKARQTSSTQRTGLSSRHLRLHEYEDDSNSKPSCLPKKRQSARFSHPTVTDIIPDPPTPAATMETRESADLTKRPDSRLSIESDSSQHTLSIDTFAAKVDPTRLVMQAGEDIFITDETAFFVGVLKKAAMQRMEGTLSATDLKQVVQQHVKEMRGVQHHVRREDLYELAEESVSDVNTMHRYNGASESHQHDECASPGESQEEVYRNETLNSYAEWPNHYHALKSLENAVLPGLQCDDYNCIDSLSTDPQRRNFL